MSEFPSHLPEEDIVMQQGIKAARLALLGVSDYAPGTPIGSHDIRVIAYGEDKLGLNPALFGLALDGLLEDGHFLKDRKGMLIRQDPQLQLDLQ